MLRRTSLALIIVCQILAGGVQLSAAPLSRHHAAAPLPQEPEVVEFVLGHSTQGRPITATRVGSGPRSLWLVGNTHGTPEANTYQLVLALQDHFRSHPEQVPRDVRLYLVPTVNPDGLALSLRNNARDVDLNRNMNTTYDACPENDWQTVIFGAYGQIISAGGAAPETEVETQLVREMLMGASAVIFYHSDGGVVFPAFCEHQPSIALAQVYAEAGNYIYSRYWENYMITGGMHDWAASLGIAAIIPELATGEHPDIEQNLAAVQAVLAQASTLLPLPEPVKHPNGAEVQAFIWRYWRSHGAEEAFGEPISPTVGEDGLVVQYFERARIALNLERLETLDAFEVIPEGRQIWTQRLLEAPTSPFQPR